MRISNSASISTIGILLVLLFPSVTPAHQRREGDLQNLKLKKGLKEEVPFAAIVLRDGERRFDGSRQIHILVEPSDVTERNLLLLFKVVSEQCSEPSLIVWVYTDVAQLAALSTGQNMSGGPTDKHQLVYYERTDKVELFRYNPNYPEEGRKTVLLKGKE